jgi:hypothetical protein
MSFVFASVALTLGEVFQKVAVQLPEVIFGQVACGAIRPIARHAPLNFQFHPIQYL